MQINFDAVVLLKTDKQADATGHPIDRVEMNNFVEIIMDEDKFSPTYEGFEMFARSAKQRVLARMSEFLNAEYISGNTNSTEVRTYVDGGNDVVRTPSEFHIIKTSEVRNIVLLEFDETILEQFEKVKEVSF